METLERLEGMALNDYLVTLYRSQIRAEIISINY